MAYFKRKLIFIKKFLFQKVFGIFVIFLMPEQFSADKETGALYYE